MGSFANSLHIKCDSESAVGESIAEIMRSEGWQPTEKLPSGDFATLSPSPRGFQISAAAGGWVSILDSDIGGPQALGPALAKRLKTQAIFVYVNDSDSWGYILANSSGKTSEFDSAESAGGDFGGDFGSGDFGSGDQVASGAAIQKVQALMQDGGLYQRMQEMQKQMLADAPPEIRAALERMQSGQGSAADMQQYQAWAMQQMPKYMEEVKSLLGGALGPGPAPAAKPAKKRRATKAQQKARQTRLDQLRPILAEGTSDEQLQEVFEKQTVFAEDVLAEFLPLVGIPALYATFSYAYFDEAATNDLAAHGIRFAHHLRFESDS